MLMLTHAMTCDLHTDGPSGVADWQTQVTTFPSSLTMAASWDVDAMYAYGKAMGEEQRGKGLQRYTIKKLYTPLSANVKLKTIFHLHFEPHEQSAIARTGMQVMLGPGVNLARVPVNGRNFEYLGEDPYLAGGLAAAEVEWWG